MIVTGSSTYTQKADVRGKKSVTMSRAESPDEQLLRRLLAPPGLDDGVRSLDYWRRRSRQLPWYRIRERREAMRMTTRWEDRVGAALRLASRAARGARIGRAAPRAHAALTMGPARHDRRSDCRDDRDRARSGSGRGRARFSPARAVVEDPPAASPPTAARPRPIRMMRASCEVTLAGGKLRASQHQRRREAGSRPLIAGCTSQLESGAHCCSGQIVRSNLASTPRWHVLGFRANQGARRCSLGSRQSRARNDSNRTLTAPCSRGKAGPSG